MNILVCSAGRRVKIIEYMKENITEAGGKVIATDCDSFAPALYYADSYEIVPRIEDPNYIEELLEVCQKHCITGVVSLIDPELEVLSKHRQKFEKNSIELIISPLDVIEKTFDKYETYCWLYDLDIPVVPTYKNYNEVLSLIEKKQLSFPLVVKPAKGSASLGIYILDSLKELKYTLSKSDEFIVQPYYKEREFGIDVYIDLINGELIDMFIKEKVKMRSGETDKSISIHNEKIEELIKEFISKTSFRGPIDIDCFEFQGAYYISEINPRFGGGYPHAYEMGCNFMSYIIKNLQGKENIIYNCIKYKEDYIMMKFDEVKLIHSRTDRK